MDLPVSIDFFKKINKRKPVEQNSTSYPLLAIARVAPIISHILGSLTLPPRFCPMQKSLPLFQALFSKNKAKFLKLAKSGNYPFTETDPSGRMLLSNAVIAEMPEAVALLLGRKPELLAKDEKGWTALHFAAYCNNVTIAQQLMEVFPAVDVKDTAGNTPLGRAVIEEHIEMVAYFVKAGADPNIKNESEISPLDFARTIEHEKMVDLMTE